MALFWQGFFVWLLVALHICNLNAQSDSFKRCRGLLCRAGQLRLHGMLASSNADPGLKGTEAVKLGLLSIRYFHINRQIQHGPCSKASPRQHILDC